MSDEARRRAARIAAPIAFLLAVTVTVVLVRSGLQSPAAEPPPTAPRVAEERSVVVRDGDTLVAIAAEHGTTVAVLRRLNPGIDPVALTAGQRIRVR